MPGLRRKRPRTLQLLQCERQGIEDTSGGLVARVAQTASVARETGMIATLIALAIVCLLALLGVALTAIRD